MPKNPCGGRKYSHQTDSHIVLKNPNSTHPGAVHSFTNFEAAALSSALPWITVSSKH
jgi:hypothetical protein